MQALEDDTFREIADLMHASVGLSFGPAKKALVSSRLAPRIQRLGLGGFEAYLDLIRRGDGAPAGADADDEFQTAVDLLTTNETYFFREPEHFERIAHEFPVAGQRPVSVWSAASSFGDEAYSVAMVLDELHAQGRIGSAWSVLGTDISDRVLQVASEGIYPEERLRHVSPQRLRRHCLRGEGDCAGLSQVREHLRAHVSFGRLNLCAPIDVPGPFDVVFLRNVLIYFDAPTKRAVVDRVLAQLRPGGLFFLGMAEGRVDCSQPLVTLGPGAFRKPAR